MSVIDLEKELEKIIYKQSINAIFQPIFNISTQKVHGFEALSRGPEHSPLYSPVPLFKTAEHLNKLSELETLCRSISINAFKACQLKGKLFINISPKALLDPDHPKGLTLQLIKQMGLKPEDVVIELSEQYPADDIDLLKDCLNHYRNQGFLTAIDDLGAGYSGLRLWSELSPDYVKIDRHFIHQIDSTAVKQEFVRSIVELCQNLTCKVIAEGIETPEELTMLKQLGVTYCQGYLLGRPNIKPNTHMDSNLVSMPLPPQTRYCETAESLCSSANIAPPETKLKQLSEQFIAQPALQAIVIAQNGHPEGIVSRNHILELFSTPYGRALHENHPASAVMDRQVLQIDASEPLSAVSQLLTSETATTVAQQFIILRHDKLIGIGHTKDLLQRITEHRIKVARHANPLSNLPGNVPIQEELKRLRSQKKPFYLAYFDLCHFKPYNDIYGFSRGDEVIMQVANLLSHHQNERCFVGHIGGDDFVMICTCQDALTHGKAIVEHFEQSKRTFYSAEHWQTQTMHAKDRQGNMVDHPLISLCVGVLPPAMTHDTTDHKLSMLSAEAKKQAKYVQSKVFILDDRQQKTA
ncbi:D-glycero-D-manno-heptose 1-phosphate guanosyltransferase [Shewanella sp. UCD-FRSSP16_17]|uniref:GGDEF domain-containing protein n=1 Tax=Shewanella sp. UCD-FRSSP16_17 TaxID=1853256 RepID=UPI0007EEBDD3|nr:GGDEF domain-containing protein [Shewanella sp. UCD-FRSSP16_17]OBT06875.1 D-glycero-D-manno-heptose 1-phosphate guanosyltransferase [Shewanella sp. UCD-FRSSP16_17]